jgi:hypothetical protein
MGDATTARRGRIAVGRNAIADALLARPVARGENFIVAPCCMLLHPRLCAAPA